MIEIVGRPLEFVQDCCISAKALLAQRKLFSVASCITAAQVLGGSNVAWHVLRYCFICFAGTANRVSPVYSLLR